MGLAVTIALPVALDHDNCPDGRLINLAHDMWDEAVRLNVAERAVERGESCG